MTEQQPPADEPITLEVHDATVTPAAADPTEALPDTDAAIEVLDEADVAVPEVIPDELPDEPIDSDLAGHGAEEATDTDTGEDPDA